MGSNGSVTDRIFSQQADPAPTSDEWADPGLNRCFAGSSLKRGAALDRSESFYGRSNRLVGEVAIRGEGRNDEPNSGVARIRTIIAGNGAGSNQSKFYGAPRQRIHPAAWIEAYLAVLVLDRFFPDQVS